ncbi:MAG TPA: exopolysaccharide biosynthesis polyprenyl glycosylphosphotransferase [Solirubrobacterales bacterium]|nr:exopolysaccharide biosynthesis polyprenyl glycosylphosphotransferase [Solirubrobacterales bacterium]
MVTRPAPLEKPQAPRGSARAVPSAYPGALRRGQLIQRLLLGSDIFALLVAYALMIGANALDGRPAVDSENLTAFVLTLPVWLLLASVVGLYRLYGDRVDHTFADEVVPVFMVTTVWSWFLLGMDSGLDAEETQLYGAAVLWAAAIATVLCARGLARGLAVGRAWFRQPVMVIGPKAEADRVLERIGRHPECGLDPVLLLRLDRGRASLHVLAGQNGADPVAPPDPAPGWGPQPERLASWVRELGIGRVILTGNSAGIGERADVVSALSAAGITVDEVAAEPEALLSTAVLHHLEGLPMLTIRPTSITKGALVFKRMLDVSIAATALIVLAPVFLYVAIRIKLDSPGPILFRQLRGGRRGEPFQLLKFRTMIDGADDMRRDLMPATNGNAAALFKLRDDPRVTTVGARLRRWSLDELPQLWNVVRGDMSLVGPRPLPLDESALAEARFAGRAAVRPGLTGPWQVHGRSDIPFEQMIQLDYTYIAAWTMREDLRLLARTCGAVLRHRGAY